MSRSSKAEFRVGLNPNLTMVFFNDSYGPNRNCNIINPDSDPDELVVSLKSIFEMKLNMNNLTVYVHEKNIKIKNLMEIKRCITNCSRVKRFESGNGRLILILIPGRFRAEGVN